MRRATHVLALCTTVAMVGCAKKEKPPAEPMAEAPAPPAGARRPHSS